MSTFKPGDKVKFIDSYDGVYHKLKGKVLTVLWFHSARECGWPEGRVKLEELQKTVHFHSIEPRFLEKINNREELP